MFKNIQRYLLINHPIIWNTKVVPSTIILLVINLIFFLIGYAEGELDFNQSEYNYYDSNDATVIVFSVLIAIVFFIIWLVYYFKNNSFKSFYPKSNFALVKEWMILFFISCLTTLFALSFYLGKDVRIRNYYSEEEAIRRCDVLSMGSYFVDGSYSNKNIATYKEATSAAAVADSVIKEIDSLGAENSYILFKGKKYKYFSLINKNLNSYTFFDFQSDSLREHKLKIWLINQEKDSIKKVFKEYLSIANEHHLKANIDANKWYELINDYPTFENYKLIGDDDQGDPYYVDNFENTRFDSVNKYIKEVTKDVTLEYYKYYVPESYLNYNYDKIAQSWTNPKFCFETLLISLYVGLGLSLLVFSFRVTSGRNWLISLVGLAILNIIFGIFAAISRVDLLYPVMVLAIGLLSIIYFFIVLVRNKSKSSSALFLNAMLWILPALLPIIYFIIYERLSDMSYAYSDLTALNGSMSYTTNPYYIAKNQMEEFTPIFLYLNLGFTILMMLFLSFKIKKWRGLAEG